MKPKKSTIDEKQGEEKTISFPRMEKEILDFWKKNDIFQKGLIQRKLGTPFVFYDGPPGTNGVPHIGHVYQSTLKDLWCRYKSMQGQYVLCKAGWDTHGLPIELTAQKELGLNSKADIFEYTVEAFIEYCRQLVYRYRDEWEHVIARVGRFVDFEHAYATLDKDFIQTVWWILKQAWDRDLIYQGYRVNAYCPRLGTILSSHEVSQGYQEVVDRAVFVKLRWRHQIDTFFIVWTTTPWTLIGNIALVVNPDINYVKISVGHQYYVLSEFALADMIKKGFLDKIDIVEVIQGCQLAGIDYQPLWNYFESVDGIKYRTFMDEFVQEQDGSGIVHLAAYGEDDYRLIQKYNLALIQHIDLNGRFIEQCGVYADRMFDEDALDIEIIKDLKTRDRLLAHEKIKHTYPFNYKTGTRLIYYAKSSWMLKTTAFKDEMIRHNQSIHWYPSHIRDGRFGDWLESNVDWAFSRERFWGTPIPVWICQQEPEHRIWIGSIDELKQHSLCPITDDFDLHLPNIDRVQIKCVQCNALMNRVPEVLDCWIDASIMPWGQWGYPIKSGSESSFEHQYPADFICEGIDQTRGWFYGLLVMSTLMQNSYCYRHVICTELVLDKHGQKMSKSKGNVIHPDEVLEKYGADALRWVFVQSEVGRSMRFSESFVEDSVKEVLLPIWNAYRFFITYASIDDYCPDLNQLSVCPNQQLDQWILSKKQHLIYEVRDALDQYHCARAAKSILDFIDNLTNWYIRRSRRRFWKSAWSSDKKSAYDTLFDVLFTLLKVIAPSLPFISEKIYQELCQQFNLSCPESIFLCDYPSYDQQQRNDTLENEMQLVREVVRLGHSLRNTHRLKIRQPLSEMMVVCEHSQDEQVLFKFESVIKDEMNIKQLSFQKDRDGWVILKAKPNLKSLGPRLGKNLPRVRKIIEQLSPDQVNQFLQDGFILLCLDDTQYVKLLIDDLIIDKKEKSGLGIASSSRLILALSTDINDSLLREGLARELINKVQFMRKQANFAVMDKIIIEYDSLLNPLFDEMIQHHNVDIQTETLADDIIKKDLDDNARKWTLNGLSIKLNIQRR